jgi:hypothetical protein
MAEQDGWKLGEDGELELNLLTGLMTAALPEGDYAVQLQYLSDPGQSKDDPHILQIGLSHDQLVQLAEGLKRAAENPGEGK